MTAPFDSVALRIARSGEFDPAAIATLINGAYTKYEFMAAPRTSAAEIPNEIGSGELIVAEQGGRLVGTAMVRPSLEVEWPEGDAPDHRRQDALYLGLAAVALTEQGRGIGQKLVAFSESIARDRGYRQVLLGTLAEMGNVRYYEALGYRTLSRERFLAPHWGLTIDHWHHSMVKDLVPVIRPARPDEAGAITELINEAYVVEAFFKAAPARTTHAEVAELLHDATFLVADGPGGQLRGAVYVSVQGHRGYFGMLSVGPSNQRSGLGRQLIEAAEAFAAERGCAAMDLSVVHLREELPPWYEKAGYRVSGTAPWPESKRDELKLPAHFITMTKDIVPQRAATGSRR